MQMGINEYYPRQILFNTLVISIPYNASVGNNLV